MITRNFEEKDKQELKDIFSLYFTDPEFPQELSDELDLYLKQKNNDSGFYVAEDKGEIVGVIGYKNTPNYLREYARTDNPVELYIVAVKYKRKGIGRVLKSKLIEVIKEIGFSEILLFSPESHKESWGFHDLLAFERAGKVTPPGENLGYVWSKIL